MTTIDACLWVSSVVKHQEAYSISYVNYQGNILNTNKRKINLWKGITHHIAGNFD